MSKSHCVLGARRMPSVAGRVGVAVALACALTPVPATAFADDGSGESGADVRATGSTAATAAVQGQVSIRGIDTLSVGGDAFDMATVIGLGADTLYADVSVGGTVKQSNLPYTYDRATDEAGVVSLTVKSSYVAAHSGDIDVSFHMGGSSSEGDAVDGQGSTSLYDATVYAVAMRVNGVPFGSVADSIVGIRTCAPSDATQAFEAPRLVVRNGQTYRLASAGAAATPQMVDGVLYVDYELVDAAGVSASVTYVDENGAVLLRDDLGTLAAGQEQTTAVRDTVEANNRVYVPISKMPTVTVTSTSPEVVVHCLPRREVSLDTRTVTINYVTDDGTQLMRDAVEVGVGGYAYAPPKVFSQARAGSVERYVLKSGYDSRTSYDADAAAALRFAFEGASEITLVYEPEAAGLSYTVNFALVSPVDGGGFSVQIDSSETKRVTESDAATVDAPATISHDGQTYTRVGDSAYTYEWSDFAAGRLLSDTVYYTRSDVQPASPYDVTVRYVDVVSGNQLGSEVLACDSADSVLSISGPEQIEADGATYKRLTGQDAAITHRYYAPYRTYTIYYAQPGSVSEGDITVVRTDIVDGGVRYYEVASNGTTTTATTANGSSASAGGLNAATQYATVVTNGGAGDNQSAENGSEVLTPEGSSAYEERIDDNETPLASATSLDGEADGAVSSTGLIVGICAALAVAVAGVVAVARILSRKRSSASDAKEA